MPPSAPASATAAPSLGNLVRRALFSPKARLLWAVFLTAATAFVLYQALTPNPKGPSLGWDKLNHGSAFAVLAFAGLFTLREQAHPVFWTGFGLMALGAGIELGQLYVPGRSAEWADMAADSIGVGVGLLVALQTARRLDRRRQRRKPPQPGTAPIRPSRRPS